METESSGPSIHIHIQPDPPVTDLKLQQIWNYRDLIFIFTKNQFIRRYKQTILGPFWMLLGPLVQSLVHSFLFGIVVGVDTNGIPYLLFNMVSNGLWRYFSAVFSLCSHTFSYNAHLYGKVYFPRLTIPIAYILMSMVEYGISLVTLLLFSLYFFLKTGFAVNPAGLLITPFLLVWLGLMAMGLGLIVSSLTTKYRDLNSVVGILFHLWMYGTPILYPLSQIPEGTLRTLIRLNPLTPVLEICRKLFFGIGEISVLSVFLSFLFTAALLFTGIFSFNKFEKNFMDTL